MVGSLGNVTGTAQAGNIFGAVGWCLAGGRGSLLKGPHQIPGSINNHF